MIIHTLWVEHYDLGEIKMKIDVRKTLVVIQRSEFEGIFLGDVLQMFSYLDYCHIQPCPRLFQPVVGKKEVTCKSNNCSLCCLRTIDRQQQQFIEEYGDDFELWK